MENDDDEEEDFDKEAMNFFDRIAVEENPEDNSTKLNSENIPNNQQAFDELFNSKDKQSQEVMDDVFKDDKSENSSYEMYCGDFSVFDNSPL